LAIPLLVMVALAKSRSVLLELQDRGLWEQAFSSVKPSGGLCVIGGALLVVGLLALDGATIYGGAKITQARAVEYQGAKEFAELIKNEEREFLAAAKGAMSQLGGLDVETGGARTPSRHPRGTSRAGEFHARDSANVS
jgi:hypothetical protein